MILATNTKSIPKKVVVHNKSKNKTKAKRGMWSTYIYLYSYSYILSIYNSFNSIFGYDLLCLSTWLCCPNILITFSRSTNIINHSNSNRSWIWSTVDWVDWIIRLEQWSSSIWYRMREWEWRVEQSDNHPSRLTYSISSIWMSSEYNLTLSSVFQSKPTLLSNIKYREWKF